MLRSIHLLRFFRSSLQITRAFAFISLKTPASLGSSSNIIPLHPNSQNFRQNRLIAASSLPYAMSQTNSHTNAANRLIRSKSPYLLQHAYNPVDWYEWSEEAFTKASELNKPIFLSVGYSACHWCHVLAHESFEDPKIADIMNKNFINIKVDREERPDVDRLYMTFVQATSGRGGWPMSVWLTPELAPFFAGTYFPKEAFTVLCERISQTWQADPSKVRETGSSVIRQLQDLFKAQPHIFDIDVDGALKQIYNKWKKDFDPEHAGFGDAPKFPSPSMVFHPLLCFSYYSNNRTEKTEAVQMVSQTLLAIHNGGINDHVGKGIARYSVDAEWRLPHFEKMLYDQAQLIIYSTECSSLVENPIEKRQLQTMALDILEYTIRDLRSPEGAFYSAEDADSLPTKSATKATEGAFYVWKKETIDEVLGDLAPMFEAYYGVQRKGNIDPKHDAHDELSGQNQLYIRAPLTDLATQYGLPVSEAQIIISECLLKLRHYREKTRPRPHLDDKIVTAWNGLMLSALAHSASILEPDLTLPDGTNAVEKVLSMAKDLVLFIKERLWDDTRKELCRSWRQGCGPSGMCEDYACVIAGLLDMFETTGHEDYLLFAFVLQKRQDELFWDEEDGGYFASPAGDRRILVRLKDSQDGAEPSAQSVSLSNLYRLSSVITAEEYDLKSKAERTLSSQSSMITKAPYALGMMVGAAKLGMKGMKEIVITGSLQDEATRLLLRYVRSKFIPNRSLILIDPDSPPTQLAQKNEIVRTLIDNLSEKTAASLELPEVRICEAGVCGLPLKGIELELVLQ